MASSGAIKAGEGYVKLSVEKSELEKGLDEAAKQFKAFGKTVATMGAEIAAAGAAVTAPFLHGLGVFAEWGGEVLRASQRTGVGFEALQDLANGTGQNMEELTGSLRHVSVFLGQVANHATNARHAMLVLGLTSADLAGMSLEDKYIKLAGALEKVANLEQRNQLRREILGRADSANFTGGTEGIRARAAHQRELGGVMSADDVSLAKDYNRSLKGLPPTLDRPSRRPSAASATPSPKATTAWPLKPLSPASPWRGRASAE